MLAVVGDLVRNLIVLIFLNALLEMLLPQEGFRPYIRLVTGLVIVLMVVGTIAALMGKMPTLEPLAAGIGTEGPVPSYSREGGEEGIDAGHQRQVLERCRAGLEELLAREVAAAGEWELVDAAITLNEKPESGVFGGPERIDLLVRAAGSAGEGVRPISISPVALGAAEGETREGAGERTRLPALESKLADLLELGPERITVTVEE